MFKWNVEDMALMNEPSKFYVGRNRIYALESKVPREEKIAFVDSMQDGKLSYLLALQEKYDKEKEQLPKDKWGEVKTVSLKAWIKRNDTNKSAYTSSVVDDWYSVGRYTLCGAERRLQSENSGSHYDTYKDFVDECFHRQLILCEDMERKYFREHDEYSILLGKIDDYIGKYNTTFGVLLGRNCVLGDCVCDENDTSKQRKLSLEEAKLLVSKYEELEEYVKKLSSEVSIKV